MPDTELNTEDENTPDPESTETVSIAESDDTAKETTAIVDPQSG